MGKLRELFSDLFNPVFFNDQRQKVGVREITVVMGFLLAAHRSRPVFFRVPQPGFLNHLTAVGQDLLLPADFKDQGVLDMFKRV